MNALVKLTDICNAQLIEVLVKHSYIKELANCGFLSFMSPTTCTAHLTQRVERSVDIYVLFDL